MRRTGSFLSDKRAPSASPRRGVSKLDARLHLYRCRIPLCRPVRPEVNIIDLIRTNGGIRGATQFENPLRDVDIPPVAIMRTILGTIGGANAAGFGVYVHCRG